MVTDTMINAGGTAVMKSAHLTGCERAKIIYAAMEAARPTADLGEDGELIAKLRAWPAVELGNDALSAGFVATLMEQAADRIELYREAREAATNFLDLWKKEPNGADTSRAADALSAILSRSGG